MNKLLSHFTKTWLVKFVCRSLLSLNTWLVQKNVFMHEQNLVVTLTQLFWIAFLTSTQLREKKRVFFFALLATLRDLTILLLTVHSMALLSLSLSCFFFLGENETVSFRYSNIQIVPWNIKKIVLGILCQSPSSMVYQFWFCETFIVNSLWLGAPLKTG